MLLVGCGWLVKVTLMGSFGPGDTESFRCARDEVIDQFGRWAARAGRTVDPVVLQLALDYKWGRGDGRLHRWTSADLDDLMASGLRLNTVASRDTIRWAAATMTAFVDYLAASGQLDAGSEDAGRLRAAIATRATVLHADVPDPKAASTTAVPHRHADLGSDRRRRVPAVRLPPQARLAEAGAATPVVERLRGLLDWVGTGRDLHDTELPGAGPLGAPSAAFMLGLAGQLVAMRLHDGIAEPTEDGRRLAEDPLELWQHAFETLLETGPRAIARFEVPFPPWGQVLDRWCVSLLATMYATPEPIPFDTLADQACRLVQAELGLGDCRGRVTPDVAWLLEQLSEFGAIDQYGEGLVLSPLGLRGINRWLRQHGADAPVVGDLVDADAATLLDYLVDYDDEATRIETQGWCAAHGPQSPWELAAAARAVPPAARAAAFRAFSVLGPEVAAEAVWGLVDQPRVRPFALVWLLEHGLAKTGALTPEDTAMYVVETCAMALDLADADAAVAVFAPDADPAEAVGLLEQVWRVDSPYTLRLLDAVADRHPDQIVAQAARQAAHKRRALDAAQGGVSDLE
jgi:hypothetical protein